LLQGGKAKGQGQNILLDKLILISGIITVRAGTFFNVFIGFSERIYFLDVLWVKLVF
jgi:hypothetical protein